MQTLTQYLKNIMSSTLLGLPREIKELIYFDALSHAANKILVSPMQPEEDMRFFCAKKRREEKTENTLVLTRPTGSPPITRREKDQPEWSSSNGP